MGDPTDLLESLKEQYGIEEDLVAGQCVVIPANKFHDDWTTGLREKGCRITPGNRGLHPVMFVSLPQPSEKPSEPAVEKPKHSFLGKPWTSEEDKELIKGVTLGQSNELIAERLPGRTPVAVGLRINRLRKRGALPKAERGQRRKPIQEQAAAPRKPGRPRRTLIEAPRLDKPEPLTPELLAAPTPAPKTQTQPFTIRTTLTINLNVNCNDACSVENALKVLHEARRTQ